MMAIVSIFEVISKFFQKLKIIFIQFKKPQIPFLEEMAFVNEFFFWLKNRVKKKPQN